MKTTKPLAEFLHFDLLSVVKIERGQEMHHGIGYLEKRTHLSFFKFDVGNAYKSSPIVNIFFSFFALSSFFLFIYKSKLLRFCFMRE